MVVANLAAAIASHLGKRPYRLPICAKKPGVSAAGLLARQTAIESFDLFQYNSCIHNNRFCSGEGNRVAVVFCDVVKVQCLMLPIASIAPCISGS